MPNIQKSQNVATFQVQFSKKPPVNNVLHEVMSDKKLKAYIFIKDILNVSSNILSAVSVGSFLGFFTSWYFSVPSILSYSNKELLDLSAKTFIGNVGLIIPKAFVDHLTSTRTMTVFKSNLPFDLYF